MKRRRTEANRKRATGMVVGVIDAPAEVVARASGRNSREGDGTKFNSQPL
jgi:hypothetical protein